MLLIWAETERKQLQEDRGLLLQGDSSTRGLDRLQFSGRLLLTSIFFFQAIGGDQGGLHSVLAAPTVFNVISTLLPLSASVIVVGRAEDWGAAKEEPRRHCRV